MKYSLAVAALLGYVNAIQIQDMHQESPTELVDVEQEWSPEEIESQYYQWEDETPEEQQIEFDQDIFDSFVETDLDSELSYKATSCKSGIERFTRGKSNSEATFAAAWKGNKKWEDPEFGADVSSLNWRNAGYSTSRSTPPTSLGWKRVSELDRAPKYFGNLGKPLP